MRLLLLTNDFPPLKGGISTMMYEITKKLSKKHVITVIAPNFKNSKKFDIRNKKIRLIRIKNYPNTFLWSQFRLFNFLIKGILELKNSDIILCGAPFLGVIKIFTKKPVLIYTYGNDVLIKRKSKLLKWLIKFNLKKADKILTISNYTKNKLIELGIQKRKIKIISPGIEMPKKRIKIRNKRRKILTVGHLVERKGHGVVIKTIKELVKKYPDISYFIVGDGPQKKHLKYLAKKFNLEKNIKFLGEVSDKKLKEIYLKSDIFVMPSRFIEKKGSVEGYGVVFLEANSYGIPVIGGDSGGIPDVIKNGKNGFLVNPLSHKEITKKIDLLISNDKLYKQMSFEAIRIARENRWSLKIDKLKKEINNLKK